MEPSTFLCDDGVAVALLPVSLSNTAGFLFIHLPSIIVSCSVVRSSPAFTTCTDPVTPAKQVAPRAQYRYSRFFFRTFRAQGLVCDRLVLPNSFGVHVLPIDQAKSHPNVNPRGHTISSHVSRDGITTNMQRLDWPVGM